MKKNCGQVCWAITTWQGMRSVRLLLAVLLGLLLSASSAFGAQYTWSLALNVAGDWDTSATNWTGASGTPWDATNGPNNDARFTVGGTTNVIGTVNTNRITFNTASRTLQGGTINLAGSSPTITLTGTANVISSILAGSNGLTMTLNGQRLDIRGDNTYSGGTTINSGTVRLFANPAGVETPFGAGTVVLNSGAGIEFFENTISSVTYRTFNLANNFELKGNNLLTGTRAGVNETYSGTLMLNATGGGAPGATLPSNAVTFNDYDQVSTTFNNPIVGTGDLVLKGSVNNRDIYIVKGGASTYNGNTWLYANNSFSGNVVTLRLDGGALPSTTVLTMVANLAGGNNAIPTLDLYGNNQTLAGLVSASVNSGVGWFVQNSVTSTSSTLTINGAGNYTFGGTLRNNGGIGGTLAITKQGTGTQVLSGIANTYTGTTTVSGGILEIKKLANGGSSSSIGSAAVTNTNLVLNGGTLKYTGTGASDGASNRLFSVGTSGGTLDASGDVGSPMNLTGTTAVGFNSQTGARTLTLTGTNTGANTLAAIIGDNGGATSLTKDGVGQWILSGNNTHTGTTHVKMGTLALSHASNNNLASSATIRVDSGAVLDVTGLTGGNLVLSPNQTLAGSGTLTGGVTIGDDAFISPGNSPGILSTGNEIWNPAGNYTFEINDAAGASGNILGWDLLNISGSLTINASASDKFNILLTSLDVTNVPGMIDNFDDANSDSWLIAQTSSTISTYTGTDQFFIDTLAFSNPFGGTFSVVRGDNSAITGGNDSQLYLLYSPAAIAAVPEPLMLPLAVVGLLSLGGFAWWKRRPSACR